MPSECWFCLPPQPWVCCVDGRMALDIIELMTPHVGLSYSHDYGYGYSPGYGGHGCDYVHVTSDAERLQQQRRSRTVGRATASTV